MNLLQRLIHLEGRADRQAECQFREITIHGGLSREPTQARAGEHTWQREPDESLDQFTSRARAAARELRISTIFVIGGLPEVNPALCDE